MFLNKNIKTILILFIIIALGLFIRLSYLNKPEGLWNDEYLGWWISSFDFGKPLFERIFWNCHMPIYYLFLKIWCTLFGNSDIVLRLSSVFIGILNIIALFFLGITYKDSKMGTICAFFGCFSGFLIYFSQEVRLYNLVFLFSTLIAIFFLKTLKKPSLKNIILYSSFNLLLLLTHTISFVYVFFNIVIFSILLLKQNPNLKKQIFTTYIVTLIAFIPIIPFIITILTRQNLSQNWGIINFSKIFFVLGDYLTPVQNNITNSPLNFTTYLSTEELYTKTIFFLIPFMIAMYFVIRGLKHSTKEHKSLNLCGLLYFIVLIIAAILDKLVLSTKYSVEIYPALILLISVGLYEQRTKLTKILTVMYFGLTLFYICFNPNAPQKLNRPEGHKTPVSLLIQSGLAQDDYIISLYHQIYRYEKYLPFIPQNVFELNKAATPIYLMGHPNGEKELKLYGKQELKNAFLFQNDTDINKRFDSIFENRPKGEVIRIIIPTQVSFFSSNDLKRIASDDKLYKSTEIMFLAFSLAKIKLINTAFKYCDYIGMQEKDVWVILNFVKK